MSKSCYILELSVCPGGARRGEVFTYNKLEHIRRCLEQEFLARDPDQRAYAASLAVGYGETIALWIVERGKVVRGIDLHASIRIRVGDEPAMTLSEAEERDEEWKDGLSEGARIAFEIDWDAIAAAAPPLRGEPLRPGETLELEVDEKVLDPFDSYLGIADEVVYGYDDLEGSEGAPPDFEDPDPVRR